MSKDKKDQPGAGECGEVNWDDSLKSYYDKPASVSTWSGHEVKQIYRPSDRADTDYELNVGDAGSDPFTRGIHKNMFRGRYWRRCLKLALTSTGNVKVVRPCWKRGMTPSPRSSDSKVGDDNSSGVILENRNSHQF